MLSYQDNTLVMIPGHKLNEVIRRGKGLRSITEFIDYGKSRVLIDNTTLSSCYRIISRYKNSDGTVPPHYLFDLAVLSTAISYFDRVYYISTSVETEYDDFFTSLLDKNGDQIFVEIPYKQTLALDRIKRSFNEIFYSIHDYFEQSPAIIEGYEANWLKILGVRPGPPDRKGLDGMLDSPKHMLQGFADFIIEEGYRGDHLIADIFQKDHRRLNEYCSFSTYRSIFYSVIAQEIRTPYLPNSLRGASLLSLPLAALNDNWQTINRDMILLNKVQNKIDKEIKNLELMREVTRMPLSLSALFHYMVNNPSESWIDGLLWLREITNGYRKTIDKYLVATTSRDECSIVEAEMAKNILEEGTNRVANYTARASFIMKIAGHIVKLKEKNSIVGQLADLMSTILCGEDVSKYLLRYYRPYLHATISLSEMAKECIDLAPAYRKVFGVDYPEPSLSLFERLKKTYLVAGY